MANGKHNFVHLHNHSEYSLLDGAAKITDMVKTAKKMGMEALAITDHGSMYGAIEFYQAARDAGIKPLLGCEVYVSPGSRFDRSTNRDDDAYHLVLLAADNTGYRNLLRLVSLGHLEGFYYKPRVDREVLEQYSQGLICLSACLGGQIPSLILQGATQQARELAQDYQEIFGPGNFYLELQDHGMMEQKTVNKELAAISRETGIPLVATNDMHYMEQQDAEAHDVLLCIQTAKTVDEQDRMRFPGDQFYMKSPAEMAELFAWCPEALENTVEIARRCDVDIEFGTMHMPDYPVPPGHDVDSWLRHLCMERLSNRYPDASPQVMKRLDYELEVIRDMGYSGYFLIVVDFVDYAHRNKIMVGPGRGSGAGSIVAYILGITDLDPLKYKLLFERFLNPERVTMPDFDIDFCYERRGEVIKYVEEKYGRDRVAHIITFGTMAARAVVRDVGRALGLSFAETDRIAKLIPEELKMTIDKALDREPRLVELMKQDPRVDKLINIARRLEGLARHASTHAAGVVIAKEDLVNYVPLQGDESEGLVTQFTMNTLEDLGLLKMDFLGLRTLTIINNTLEMVEENRRQRIDLATLPLDDAATFELLCKANTLGVFQLESEGMRKVALELQPSRFEDIIALVAMYRPGPMEQIPTFIASKHGKKAITYPHPKLKEMLQETYGVMIYQEQIVLAAAELAGFSLGQADVLRWAIGKKKHDLMAQQRVSFVDGCLENGLSKSQAEKIFNLIVKFADYGFNKAHSAAYALIAYQTAYLKTNYPVEFMAAMLGGAMANSDKVAFYIDHCRRLGIEVLPPDINESGPSFTVVKDSIRFGLGAVKNVGVAAVEQLLQERKANGPFTSLADFCSRMNGKCNKRMLEYMIRGGCMDSLPGNRAQKLAAMDQMLSRAARLSKQRASGQLDLFESMGKEDLADKLPDLQEQPRSELLLGEKEALGLYISGHPLEDYAELLEALNVVPIPSLPELQDGQEVTVAGMVAAKRFTMTRRGKQMAFITLEDQFSSVEMVAFDDVLEQSGELLRSQQPLLIRGRLEIPTEDTAKLRITRVDSLTEPKADCQLYLKIEDSGNSDLLNRLLYLLRQHPGDIPVYLYFSHSKKVRLLDQFPVTICDQLVNRACEMLGEECVAVKEQQPQHKKQETGITGEQ